MENLKGDKKIKVQSLLALLVFMIVFLISSIWFTNFLSNEMISYVFLYVFLMVSFICMNGFKNLLKGSTLFIIYYTIFLGIGPILWSLRGSASSFSPLIIVGFLFCFMLGYLFPQPQMLIHSTYKLNYKKRDIYAKILFTISFMVWVYYIARNYQALMVNFESSRISVNQGNGIILKIINLSLLSIWILFENAVRMKSRITFSHVLICVLTAAMNFSCGSRSSVIILLIIIMAIYDSEHPIGNQKIIFYGCSFLALAVILGTIRLNISGQAMNFAGELNTTLLAPYYNLNRIFEYFPNIVPFQHGYTYLINFIQLRPGKDPDLTLWLKQQLDMSFSGGGVTPTILGELYINFGMIAIYIGGILFGFVYKTIDLCREKNNSLSLIMISIYLAGSDRGGITSQFILCAWFLLVLFVINWACKEVTFGKETGVNENIDYQSNFIYRRKISSKG